MATLIVEPYSEKFPSVRVRLHGKGHVGAKPKGEVVADVLASIKERWA